MEKTAEWMGMSKTATYSDVKHFSWLKTFSTTDIIQYLDTNRNVFHLAKSVLVLKAFRYEGRLSSRGHLAFSQKMSPPLLGHGHLPLTTSMSPPLVGNGSPSSEPCEPSSVAREWVT